MEDGSVFKFYYEVGFSLFYAGERVIKDFYSLFAGKDVYEFLRYPLEDISQEDVHFLFAHGSSLVSRSGRIIPVMRNIGFSDLLLVLSERFSLRRGILNPNDERERIC